MRLFSYKVNTVHQKALPASAEPVNFTGQASPAQVTSGVLLAEGPCLPCCLGEKPAGVCGLDAEYSDSRKFLAGCYNLKCNTISCD